MNLGEGHTGALRSTSIVEYGQKRYSHDLRAENVQSALTRKASFQYGCTNMRSMAPFSTTSTVNHNFKGDASQLRGRLDAEKCKDLRTNHFSIGGPSANVSRTM